MFVCSVMVIVVRCWWRRGGCLLLLIRSPWSNAPGWCGRLRWNRLPTWWPSGSHIRRWFSSIQIYEINNWCSQSRWHWRKVTVIAIQVESSIVRHLLIGQLWWIVDTHIGIVLLSDRSRHSLPATGPRRIALRIVRHTRHHINRREWTGRRMWCNLIRYHGWCCTLWTTAAAATTIWRRMCWICTRAATATHRTGVRVQPILHLAPGIHILHIFRMLLPLVVHMHRMVHIHHAGRIRHERRKLVVFVARYIDIMHRRSASHKIGIDRWNRSCVRWLHRWENTILTHVYQVMKYGVILDYLTIAVDTNINEKKKMVKNQIKGDVQSLTMS